ncbi:MAG: hypothetical protein A3J83_07325 [Elusimicrobia bacterium RIFOXYA2_FULL_40_6]|nr:MAG: hypothetical protein A3J83_07325 [Elusimicrobia bacterium RIFOXYA2_FULL_40_6]
MKNHKKIKTALFLQIFLAILFNRVAETKSIRYFSILDYGVGTVYEASFLKVAFVDARTKLGIGTQLLGEYMTSRSEPFHVITNQDNRIFNQRFTGINYLPIALYYLPYIKETEKVKIGKASSIKRWVNPLYLSAEYYFITKESGNTPSANMLNAYIGMKITKMLSLKCGYLDVTRKGYIINSIVVEQFSDYNWQGAYIFVELNLGTGWTQNY